MAAAPPVGVCSWSLDRHDPLRAVASAAALWGVTHVQVGFFSESSVRAMDRGVLADALRDRNLTVSGVFLAFEGEDYGSIERIAATGGYADDGEWARRFALTREAADVAAAIGAGSLAVHAGTVPSESSPLYARLIERVRAAADAAAERSLLFLLETGRESADALAAFVERVNRPHTAVNFDPANFVIHGTGDPVRAVSRLKGLIRGVHMKDAIPSAHPSIAFGRVVPLGSGAAQIPRVISKLRVGGYGGPLLIESDPRRWGMDDIRNAVNYLKSMLG